MVKIAARMARKLRLQYPGAIYHAMNRGDRREPIFTDDQDRTLFLETLGEACAKRDWQVHAFCLMGNHFHLVAETPRGNLVEGMKWLLGVYTSRFNHRHKAFGHLFSGRYKAVHVDGSGNGYLKTVCDYVHLNPVRGGLVAPDQPLQSYRWSSYPLYLEEPPRRPTRAAGGPPVGRVGNPQRQRGRAARIWRAGRSAAPGRGGGRLRTPRLVLGQRRVSPGTVGAGPCAGQPQAHRRGNHPVSRSEGREDRSRGTTAAGVGSSRPGGTPQR